jgi:hypothetical protein
MEENFTETTHVPPQPEKGMVLSEEALYYLQTGAKWAKFLAIMGFIGCAFVVLMGLFAGSLFSRVGGAMQGYGGAAQGMGAFMSVFYIAFALLYFFPSLYLYQFANFAQKAIMFSNSQDITLAMGKLKSFFKFVGILIIVIISLYLLIVIGVFAMMGTYSAFRQ